MAALSKANMANALSALSFRGCGTTKESLSRCSRCKRAYYCSRDCQVRDHCNHKEDCGHCFSVAQLFDVNAPKKVAAARSHREQAGQLLYDIIPGQGNGMTFDRSDPTGPHAQAWATGMGLYYVATDIAQIKFGNTELSSGQYYRQVKQNKWQRFDDGQAAPGNVGGFHAAVIETNQPDTDWVISAKIVSTNIMGMEMICPTFIAVSRADYVGFISLPKNTKKDECRCHWKIQDFHVETGRILTSDYCSVSINGRRLADKGEKRLFTGAGHKTEVGSSVVATPMDGYFPITVHRDNAGEIALIMIRTT